MIAFLLVVAFIVVPVVELAVIIEVGSRLGIITTLGLLVLVSLVGAWLVRHQGIATLRRIRAALATGVLPAPDLIDGAAIIVAGTLLLTPGFVTDAVGLLLLLPPTRALVRGILRRFLLGRVAIRDVRFRRPATDAPPMPPNAGPASREPWPPSDELPPPS